MSKLLQILVVTPYPIGEAPSQRFRFEQYLTSLKPGPLTIFTVEPFFNLKTWKILYKKGYFFSKILGIVTGFGRRKLLLFKIKKYDYVLIHREAAPLGPPVFEWLIARVFKKKIIYDFDDAIWLPNTSESNKMAARLKWHHKVGSICRWSYKISAGNAYLAEYARKFNANVIVNPTTIDTENLHNPRLYASKASGEASATPVIGWTGSHSTLVYLLPILPVLKRLEEKYTFRFKVIANHNPQYNLKSYSFTEWKKDSEIEDLLDFDIGIMPLVDDPWAKGKCGFKALQYMALEIPTLISPVGVNKEIVTDGVEGYHCVSESDWYQSLEKLLTNPDLRRQMGKKGREKVKEGYSVQSNRQNFSSLFDVTRS